MTPAEDPAYIDTMLMENNTFDCYALSFMTAAHQYTTSFTMQDNTLQMDTVQRVAAQYICYAAYTTNARTFDFKRNTLIYDSGSSTGSEPLNVVRATAQDLTTVDIEFNTITNFEGTVFYDAASETAKTAGVHDNTIT
jgi:hypothetical protein